MNVPALNCISGQPLFSADSFLEAIPYSIEYAFQPIVNINTGAVYGFEALLRGHERMGLSSIQSFFDHAWQLGVLHQADLALRQKALLAFSNIPAAQDKKLFFNLDGRCFESPDYNPEQTMIMMRELDFAASTLCLELSEKYDNSAATHVGEILARCRSQSFHIAIDDYGQGFSQLKMLYEHQPDYLKIDRFFVDGMATDNKKKLMVGNVAQMAHTLGITVIAEGMEREEDLLACLNAGCDMAQGYLIQRPQTDLVKLADYYEIVTSINSRNRRQKKKKGDRSLIDEQIDSLPSVIETDNMKKVLDAFQRNEGLTFLPVIETTGHPRGLVSESSLRALLYNPFGHALLTNKGLGNPLERLIARCPIADIDSSVEDILAIYTQSQNPDGILIVEEHRYVGFLSAQSLLHLLHEKRLEQARDQNPLSKLPGNHSIMDYIASCLEQDSNECHLVYFDFNDFKPFNDQYGFRQGDRAILLFTEIMKRQLCGDGVFLGHIGGDDFFAGFCGVGADVVMKEISTAISMFASDIESFYDTGDRKRGYIECQDRNGDMRRFPLLSCSAAIIVLEATSRPHNQDALLKEISRLKKQAKKSPDYIAVKDFPGAEQDLITAPAT